MSSRREFLTASALCASVIPGHAPANARRVRTGADVLAASGWRGLSGRVGIITNPTGVLSTLDHVVDSMHTSGAVDLAVVFGPEHGFRGTAQAGSAEDTATDPRTGLPVRDLYGRTVDQVVEVFRATGVQRVVFDIADVGARFYTYIWTLYTAMRAAARVGIPLVVLDRPNPLGSTVDGPRLDPRFASGVGMLPIPLQHGMTVGELARLFAGEYLRGHSPALEVIPLRGWSRETTFTTTGLAWVPPSPNMPTPGTAAVYPGTGLFEGTVLSEGRGTTKPFEILGAPGIDWRWAEELNAAGLPGVRFRETYFVPTFSKYANTPCGGVQLHHTGRIETIRTAVTMLVTAHRLYPRIFGWRPDHAIDQLAGSDRLRRMVDAGARPADILGSWATDPAEFRRQREPYLLYR